MFTLAYVNVYLSWWFVFIWVFLCCLLIKMLSFLSWWISYTPDGLMVTSAWEFIIFKFFRTFEPLNIARIVCFFLVILIVIQCFYEQNLFLGAGQQWQEQQDMTGKWQRTPSAACQRLRIRWSDSVSSVWSEVPLGSKVSAGEGTDLQHPCATAPLKVNSHVIAHAIYLIHSQW